MEVGKLSLESKDIAEEKRQELLRLFPEAQTEGGKIDFDQLKRALGETVDTGKERYGMNWPGKADCFRLIQSPSTATLLPVREESVRFDETENMIIEGDNLEVLKLLQKGYQSKIKMIYIDPPYNTGNDFIYPDDFADNLKNYLQYTGQANAEGKRFSDNLDTDGRFHSKWLNMMYPRLYLARNLLREDGVIFVSIDDSEVTALRSVLNAVFGEDCFISSTIIQANKRGQTYKEIAKTHEYLLIYSRSPEATLNELEKPGEGLPFSDSRGPYDLWELRNRNPKFGRFNRPNLYFPIFAAPNKLDETGYSMISLIPDSDFTVEILPRNSEGEDGCWRWGKDKLNEEDTASKTPVVVARRRRDGGWNIYEKSRKSTTKAKSLWTDSEVISEQGTIELGALGLSEYFDHPKPTALVRKCLQIGMSPGDVVLDFFAGSGTTASAALELNEGGQSGRRFILVQLPEPIGQTETESDSKFKTIADVTVERVRRVIERQDKDAEGKLDLQHEGKSRRHEGFRVFKLAPSNFKVWDAHTDEGVEGVERQMELAVNHIMPDRTAEDLFYEILMKSEYPLTAKVKNFDAAGIAAYSVEDDALIVCVERKVTAEAVAAIAKRKPSKVIFLDEAFSGNDQLKANAKMNFESAGVKRFETV